MADAPANARSRGPPAAKARTAPDQSRRAGIDSLLWLPDPRQKGLPAQPALRCTANSGSRAATTDLETAAWPLAVLAALLDIDLKQHILIAVDVVAAAKAGDNPKLADADKRWHDNAADLAAFLSGANKNWPKAALLSMLNEHLALTTQEATARLQQRWDDDIAAFDKVLSQAIMMALSDGIAKQFPRKV